MDRSKRLKELAKHTHSRMKSNPLESALLLLAFIASIFIVRDVYVVIFKGYVWKPGSGFAGKSLWEWMELALIPLVLALGAYFFNRSERRNEQKIAADRQNDLTLQNYLDRMTDLLLGEKLIQMKGKKDNPIVNIAQARTVTTIRALDKKRRNLLFQFLRDAKLADFILIGASLEDADLQGTRLYGINLQGANLSRANLQRAYLGSVNLGEAILVSANLREANLLGADLQDAELMNADLQSADFMFAKMLGANLSGADLRMAKFEAAEITQEILAKAKSLQGATLPDGTVHE